MRSGALACAFPSFDRVEIQSRRPDAASRCEPRVRRVCASGVGPPRHRTAPAARDFILDCSVEQCSQAIVGRGGDRRGRGSARRIRRGDRSRLADSTPAWPVRAEPPDGAPNVVYIVLDDVGYARSVATARSSTRPTSTRWRRRACGSPTSTPPRCARRRAAACSPGRNHHTNGMGRVADLAMGFPGYWGVVPPENGFLSEILRTHGYSTYAVGKWHLTPDDETHMAADRSSWPLGRGFDRWYGFHGGETHQFVPTLYCDNHSVQPPRTPAEGYHLTEDLVDHAIEYLSDLRNADGEQPFFLYFATGACHSPHHAPPEWIERYRGVFDDGWDALRERILARQVESGIVPRRHRAVAAPAVGAGVGRARARGPEGRGALHGVLRRLPLAHRRPDRPAARAPRGERRRRQHDRRPRVRQRRQLGRRRDRLDQRRPHGQPRPRGAQRDARAHRRARRSLAAQQLPVGLDHGRQHAVQALEARGARGRRRRSVHRALAGALRGRRRRDPPPVRARHRRDADRARPDRRGGARPHPRPGAEPDPRHELRPPVRRRRRDRARSAHHAALRDARFARAVPRGLEGGDVQAARPDHRRHRARTRSWRRSTTTSGSCTTSRSIRRRCTTSPPTSPSGSRA